MLGHAAQHATASVFIMEAKNDYNLQPAEVPGKIASANGGQAGIYAALAKLRRKVHWAFATTSTGTTVWG